MNMLFPQGKQKALTLSYDKTIVHNPTVTDVWFMQNKQTYCIKAGETLYI